MPFPLPRHPHRPPTNLHAIGHRSVSKPHFPRHPGPAPHERHHLSPGASYWPPARPAGPLLTPSLRPHPPPLHAARSGPSRSPDPPVHTTIRTASSLRAASLAGRPTAWAHLSRWPPNSPGNLTRWPQRAGPPLSMGGRWGRATLPAWRPVEPGRLTPLGGRRAASPAGLPHRPGRLATSPSTDTYGRQPRALTKHAPSRTKPAATRSATRIRCA
jgi:hypothetical protein